MSGFLYLPPFVFRASTLRCPSSSGVYGCLPFDFSWLRLPASALWHPPAPSSVVAVVAYTFFVPSGVSHRLTIFPSCTLTPSVLIPVSEPSPFLPDFVLPPARDITKLQDALVACYEEPQDCPKLPNTVRHAIDKVLCELAERMEHWDYSVLPFTAGDASNDDDNEHDTAIFSTLHARYARREIEYYKHAVPAADKRFLYVFVYLAPNEPALLQKWRLDNAERLEVAGYPPAPGSRTWADFELFNVDKSGYEVAGRDLDLIGRGRILIFRKTGVATADCPSLDRRERWALASAKDADSQNYHVSDASSPLPSSSPANWSDSDEETMGDSTQTPKKSVKVGLSGKKRQRAQLATEVTDEEDTVAAKKPKRAQLTSTTLSHAAGTKTEGHGQSTIYVSTSDPDVIYISDTDDSSDVEIVENPIAKLVV
ncbi:hypothetical protein B0H12DRAFT_1242020 [Mycena haematopus]|nr:hypothetical protein B0H12DRAFT_1242020 [Mycena haematopus]